MPTDTGPLQDEGRAQGAAGNDDLLPRPDNLALVLGMGEWLSWDNLHPDCSISIEDDFVHLRVAHKVQVLVFRPCAMDVGMSRVRATSGVTVMGING